MPVKKYFVYILCNESVNIFYVGFTSDLSARIFEHKNKLVDSFTSKYNLTKLVYFEEGEDYDSVLAREKQIKKWSRIKKISLINSINPNFSDLYNQICD